MATQNGHVDVCTLLLENNAHINQQRNNEEFALWIAAQYGHVDLCTLFFENNAHVNQK